MHPVFRISAWIAIVSGIAALFVAPFLAAAYVETEDGRDDPPLLPWTGAFRSAVGGMLTDDADAMYAAYGKGSWTLGVAILAATIALHAAHRGAGGRAERIGSWMLGLGGALSALGTLVAYFAALLEVAFLALLVPGMILMIVGSVVFGVGAVKARVVPRGLAWLVLASGPAQPVLSAVLGHNMIAFAPLLVASIWAGAWHRKNILS